MQDGLARIKENWLPVGLAVVLLAMLWLVTVFGDEVGVGLEENISILTLALGGGLLAAFVVPRHPLRSGILGGAALLALAWVARAVSQAALGKVNVDEYGSWQMYWLTSLIALNVFAIVGGVLGYVGGYIVRSASRTDPRMHSK